MFIVIGIKTVNAGTYRANDKMNKLAVLKPGSLSKLFVAHLWNTNLDLF